MSISQIKRGIAAVLACSLILCCPGTEAFAAAAAVARGQTATNTGVNSAAGSVHFFGTPRRMATGLRKLGLLGIAMGKLPHGAGSWVYKLFLSHPDPVERVQTMGRMMKK